MLYEVGFIQATRTPTGNVSGVFTLKHERNFVPVAACNPFGGIFKGSVSLSDSNVKWGFRQIGEESIYASGRNSIINDFNKGRLNYIIPKEMFKSKHDVEIDDAASSYDTVLFKVLFEVGE